MQPSSQDACQLLFSTIIHVRYQQSASKDSPARPAHTLSRKGLSVVLDLDRLTDADKQSSLFSINKFNLLSFNERDYGPNHSSQKRQKLSQKIPLADYVREVASSYMDSRIIHQIQLITFPRILGLSFNPISVYRCLTNRGEDCFIMYEVHNTFGDAHIYNNHMEQVELQLSRDCRPLPTMKLNPAITNIFDFTFDDFTLEGYDPHPHIKGIVAV